MGKYIVNVSKKEKKKKQLKEWKQKALHGQFLREEECDNESKRWEWLRKGRLEISYVLHKSKLLELIQ